MTTKTCCGECFDYSDGPHNPKCKNSECKCHTSLVSEVIAEAVKELDKQYGVDEPDGTRTIISGNGMQDTTIEEWLTTTLNRVASVAREETEEQDKTVIHGRSYDEGAQAMKEKILAALDKIEPQYDFHFGAIRQIITDLK